MGGTDIEETDPAVVEIRIDRDFQSFTEKEQETLLQAIGHLLALSQDIRVVSKHGGSVLLRLELKADEAEQLVAAARAGLLAEFAVVDVSVVGQSTRASTAIKEAVRQQVDSLATGHEEERSRKMPRLEARGLLAEAQSVGDEAGIPADGVPQTLLERARDNDPDAWRRLVDVYSPCIYNWARQQGLSPPDTADVLQDVFRTVAANLGRFRRDRPSDSFRAWLRMITRSKIRDLFRSRSQEPRAVGGDEHLERLQKIADPSTQESDQLPDFDETSALTRRALELVRTDFQETTWRAFWRVAIDQQSSADVAQELGLSVSNVRMAKARVLRRIREEFGDVID